MHTQQGAREDIAKRGPRYAVYGVIRPGEARVTYADTAERAEQIREDFQGNWHYRNVEVYPPAGSVDLAELGRARQKVQRELDEATMVLRAAVLRAAEEGRSEVEIARTAQVDRMTVRKWLGK